MLQIFTKRLNYSLLFKNKSCFCKPFKASSRRVSAFKKLGLNPKLTQDVAENMETVVALDIRNDRVSWFVEDKHRVILDYREVILFEKPPIGYNLVNYQSKVLDVVNSLPDSNIYVLEYHPWFANIASSKVKYVVERAVINAMFILLINATKGKKLRETVFDESNAQDSFASEDGRYGNNIDAEHISQDVSDIQTGLSFSNTNTNSDVRRQTHYQLSTNVYMFSSSNFRNLYSLVLAGERVSAYPIVSELLDKKTGPLQGLVIPSHIQKHFLHLSRPIRKEHFSKTLLMADSVVQLCLEIGSMKEEVAVEVSEQEIQ